MEFEAEKEILEGRRGQRAVDVALARKVALQEAPQLGKARNTASKHLMVSECGVHLQNWFYRSKEIVSCGHFVWKIFPLN